MERRLFLDEALEFKIKLTEDFKLNREDSARIAMRAGENNFYIFSSLLPPESIFALKRGEDWYAVKINLFFFIEGPPKFLDDRVEVIVREFTPEKNKIKLIFIFK